MVEGTGLENQHRVKPIAGSNPALSAIFCILLCLCYNGM